MVKKLEYLRKFLFRSLLVGLGFCIGSTLTFYIHKKGFFKKNHTESFIEGYVFALDDIQKSNFTRFDSNHIILNIERNNIKILIKGE